MEKTWEVKEVQIKEGDFSIFTLVETETKKEMRGKSGKIVPFQTFEEAERERREIEGEIGA